MQLESVNNRIRRVSDGAFVVLRGAGCVNYYWKYKSNRNDYQSDLRMLDGLYADWNAMAATIWFAAGPVVRDEPEFMTYLDRCVEIAVNRERYLILSFAGPEPDQGTHPYLIPQAGIQAHALLAKRYAHVPNIIHATQAEPGEFVSRGNTARWLQLRDRQEQTVDAIRSEKPGVLVLVSGTRWSQDVFWMTANPVRRENIAVKPHLYEGRNDGTTMERNIVDSGTLAVSETYPIVIGEFGWGGRSNAEDIRVLIREAERNLWGYQAWNLNNEGPPVMLNSKNPSDRNAYGDLVHAEMWRDPTPTPPIEPGPMEAPVRINAGGGVLAEDGKVYRADAPWTSQAQYGFLPASARNASHNTGLSNLLATERWGLAEYRVRVPEGTYDVVLTFAETYEGITGPGQRVFDVSVGNKQILGVDVYREAGFRQPLTKTFHAVPTVDGIILVEFTAKADHPMLKAIEVVAHVPQEPTEPGDFDDLLREIAVLKEDVSALEAENAALESVVERVREAVLGA